MSHILSYIPPLAWLLIFFTLLFGVSYLYIKNKNLGKLAIGVFFTLALIGGWSLGEKFAQETKQEKIG